MDNKTLYVVTTHNAYEAVAFRKIFLEHSLGHREASWCRTFGDEVNSDKRYYWWFRAYVTKEQQTKIHDLIRCVRNGLARSSVTALDEDVRQRYLQFAS